MSERIPAHSELSSSMGNTRTVLSPFVPGRIWFCEYEVRYGGMNLEARTTFLRLANGDLFVHSPCPLDSELERQVARLGHVAHVVSPGTFHHLRVAAWVEAYPAALDLLEAHPRLSPRHALHVATMEHRELHRLLSTDRDFDVAPQIERVAPDRFLA